MKNSYFFPDFLAKAMSKIDLRTQLEGSMLSMALIMAGLAVTTVYIILYVAFPLWYKVIVVINCLAGILFMASFITTTFQQYQNYLEAIEFQSAMKGGQNAKENTERTTAKKD